MHRFPVRPHLARETIITVISMVAVAIPSFTIASLAFHDRQTASAALRPHAIRPHDTSVRCTGPLVPVYGSSAALRSIVQEAEDFCIAQVTGEPGTPYSGNPVDAGSAIDVEYLNGDRTDHGGASIPCLNGRMSVGSTIVHGLAAPTGCNDPTPPCNFNLTFEGTYGTIANTGGASAVISSNENRPVYCSYNGTSLWEAIAGPNGEYAQAGWLDTASLGKRVFSEYTGLVDNQTFHRFLYPAPTGSHTYTTEVVNPSGQGSSYYYGEFFEDGNGMDSIALTWPNGGSGEQFNQENHSDDDHWLQNTFSSTRYCQYANGSGYCNPQTPSVVFPVASSGLPPSIESNRYECYYKGGADTFHLNDTRDNGGHC